MANGFGSTNITSFGSNANSLPLGFLSNQKGSTAQVKTNDEQTKDPILKTVNVTLAGKPPGMSAGEYLMRQALEQIAPSLGLTAADIDLEIQSVKDKENGNFIQNLSFGKNKIEKPNDLTDEAVNALVAKGNKNVGFGIHQSTVQRMLARDEIVKWLAGRDALGIPVTEADKNDLARLGFSPEDVGRMRDAKTMQYWGYREKALADVNGIAKQKLIADRVEYLTAHPEEVIKEGDNVSASRIDFLTRATAAKEINDALANSKMTPLEYAADKKNFEQSLADLRAWEERTADMPTSTYLQEGGKNLVNSFYYGIGEAIKGLSVVAVNNSIYIDKNGKQINPQASDTLGYKIGDWIQQNVQAPNVNKDIERTFAGGVLPKTVGGLLPAVFGAWATKSPTAFISIYDGLRTGGSIYDEAKRAGATEAQAQNSALLTGGFVGLTDRFGYGKTLETLNSGAGAKTWQTIFREAIKDGGRNAGVAGAQTVFENGVAKNIYDLKRGYLDNVEERMIAAGITGAALKSGLEIVAKVHAGANPKALNETRQIFRIEKPSLELQGARQVEFRNSGIDLKAKLNEKLNAAENNSTQPRRLSETEQLSQTEAVKIINQVKRSEPAVSKDLQTVAKQTGGEMVGFEYRFKSEESLTRKINDSTARETTILLRKGIEQKDAFSTALNKQTNKINDALRYTISFTAENYKAGYETTINSLREKGYKIDGAWNAWLDAGTSRDSGYRGINVTVISPSGQKFELQFHTPESFKMKMETHELYEEKRLNTTSFERKNEITKIMVEKAKTVPIP
jgi:hypothetical protein